MNLRASLDGIYLLIPTGDNNIIVITAIISKPPLEIFFSHFCYHA